MGKGKNPFPIHLGQSIIHVIIIDYMYDNSCRKREGGGW